MERQILLADSKTQKRYTFNSKATTLGELKEELKTLNVNYTDMDFTEGISKTTLVDDSSQLPSSVMYKGTPTNNLIILLSPTSKKIESGAYPTDRKLFKQYIDDNNLKVAITQRFNQNWTRISTKSLIDFFKDFETSLGEVTVTDEVTLDNNQKVVPHINTVQWFCDGVKRMIEEKMLFVEDINELINQLTNIEKESFKNPLNFDTSNIDNILADL